MLKYAKIIDDNTGLCDVGIGTNAGYYVSIGMKELDVEQSEVNGQWYLTEKCPMKSDEEKAKEEEDRINRLTMTPLDFIGVLQGFGLSLEQINAYLESNLPVKIQLTYCSDVFCGVAKSFMPITFENITITSDMVENAFILKHGENIQDNSAGEGSTSVDETSNPPAGESEEE